MAITAIVVGTVGVGYSIYAGEQQKKQQQKSLAMQASANKEAVERGKEAADRADVATNRANRKKVEVGAIRSKEEQAALSGPAGTMLTGVEGVKLGEENLGGNTLLGS